jgi:hypothetical protein
LVLVAQIEKSQTLRVQEVANNLLRYIDELWGDSEPMFDMHVRNMAREKLATAEYGPVMLITLGKVYRLQAKRARGNVLAYFRCVRQRHTRHLGTRRPLMLGFLLSLAD